MNIEKKIHIEINSDTKEIEKVQDLIKNEAKTKNYPEKTVDFVLPLILDELLRNAIKHGNKNIYNKKVIIDANILPDCFELNISDNGLGYDYKNILNGDASEFSSSGRGLFIVNSYADKLEFLNEGRTVKIIMSIKR